MSLWTPPPEWAGEDAFIIGGGPSLAGFDFTKLKGRHVIGCNDAFHLGPEIVTYVLFGDVSFWHLNRFKLEKCGSQVVTCAPSMLRWNLPKVHRINRSRHGLSSGSCVGWNYSTGCAAVNLALNLGAVRVFLLGFDMGKRYDGKSHWHDHRKKVIQDSSYLRFIEGFQNLFRALEKERPEIQVINVTDGSSKLPLFPRITFSELDEVLTREEVVA